MPFASFLFEYFSLNLWFIWKKETKKKEKVFQFQTDQKKYVPLKLSDILKSVKESRLDFSFLWILFRWERDCPRCSLSLSRPISTPSKLPSSLSLHKSICKSIYLSSPSLTCPCFFFLSFAMFSVSLSLGLLRCIYVSFFPLSPPHLAAFPVLSPLSFSL